MRIVKLSANQFDKFALTHRYRNYYQSSMYANVMTKFGYRGQYLGAVDDNNKLIGATLIIYKEVFMGNKIAYAPRGILFNYEKKEETKEFIHKLKKTLSKQNFMLLRMDPYVPLTILDYEGNMINLNNNGQNIIDNIVAAGFHYKGKNMYFETEKPRFEALVLLQKDIHDIYTKIDKRTKNKIRKATNSGVEVYKDTSLDVTELHKLVSQKDKKPLSYYQTLCEKFDGSIDIYYAKVNANIFLINSRRSYEKELEYNEVLANHIQDMSLSPSERENSLNKKMESDKLITVYKSNLLKSTDLLKNNPDGIIVGAAMVLKYDNAAYVIAEGMNEDYGNLNALSLIKWQMINDYNSHGLKYLNLGGVVGNFENPKEYAGLNESKLGMDTTVSEYIGEFDIVLNSFTYNLYKKMNKK